MHRFFADPSQIGEKEIVITGADVNHIRNVLRMKPGEELRLCTGEDEKDYRCRISRITEEQVTAEILWVEESGVELPSRLYLFQGLPKSDKMELIIQKAVELGVYEVIPMASRRSVVKLDAKKEENKRKRWNAIAESAAKQSKRMIVPEISPVMKFEEAVAEAKQADLALIPYEDSEHLPGAGGMALTRTLIGGLAPGQTLAVFIGPEGGFSDEEIELALHAGIRPVTLGKRILRTETAALFVLSAAGLLLE